MHILLGLAILLFQTYSSDSELRLRLKLHFEEIDRMSEKVSTQAEAEKYTTAVFDNFRSLETFPDRKYWNKQLATAELATVRGEKSRISEAEVASAYNGILDELGLPDYHVGTQQIHEIRLNYSRIYPKLFERKDDGSVADDCRPVEAVLMLLQLDQIYGQAEIPARLRNDKAASEQYQASVEKYLRAKKAWNKVHKDSDFLRVAKDVAMRIHVQ